MFECVASGDGVAESAHRGGFLDTRETRQALRAGGSGDDAELDFRLSYLARLDGHAIVAGLRDFEPAAERGAVKRGDHRFCGTFENIEHRMEPPTPALFA